MKTRLFRRLCGLFACGFVLISAGFASAQETPPSAPLPAQAGQQLSSDLVPDHVITGQAQVVDAKTLHVNGQIYGLWGVDLPDRNMSFLTQARKALESSIGGNSVECDIKAGLNKAYDKALCTKASGEDLGLEMLEAGYLSLDRAEILGTPYAQAYQAAEESAIQKQAGIWGRKISGADTGAEGINGVVIGIYAGLCLVFFLGFFVLSTRIMNGFKKVSAAQIKSLDIMARERALKEKEQAIIAIMVGAEIRENQTKVQAYLAVYEEMLKGLEDAGDIPKYRRSGDIIQMQPSLSRSVFDRNTDNLAILGKDVSSQLVSFYADVKAKPDFKNVDADDEVETVKKLVEMAVFDAQKLDKMATNLLSEFDAKGFGESRS